jgi:hypothetical protein
VEPIGARAKAILKDICCRRRAADAFDLDQAPVTSRKENLQNRGRAASPKIIIACNMECLPK